MRILKHYDVDVAYECISKDFRSILREAKIQYEELPILDVDVVKCNTKEGKTYYACIKEVEDGYQSIYVTAQIPEDLDFNLLIMDVYNQLVNKTPPIKKETKLHKLISEVEKELIYFMGLAEAKNDFFTTGIIDVDIKDIVQTFKIKYANRYYTKEDIKNMDSSDIDSDFMVRFLEMY